MTFNVSGNMPAALIHGEMLTLPPLPRGHFKTWQATCSRPDVAVGGPASPRGP